MKSTLTNLVIILAFSFGLTPTISFCNVQEFVYLNSPPDTISVRLGSTRRLRSGDEFGMPKGRLRAKIIHQRWLCEDSFKTKRNGTIKRKLDFQKDDNIYYKSKWIRKPLIVTNNLDSRDSTNLTSGIEVSMNRNDSTGHIYGELIGLFSTFKYNEILIYANGVFIGHPDILGRYAAPTDENGKIQLGIVINLALVENRANITTFDDECIGVVCEDIPLYLWLINECCNPTVTSLDIDTGNDKRARVDIVYDDDRKKRAVLTKLNLMSIYDSLL